MKEGAEIEKIESSENPFGETRERIFRVKGGKDVLEILRDHLWEKFEAMMKFVAEKRELPFEWDEESFEPHICERAECIPQEILDELWWKMQSSAQEEVKKFARGFYGDHEAWIGEVLYPCMGLEVFTGIYGVKKELEEELDDESLKWIRIYPGDFFISRNRGSVFIFDEKRARDRIHEIYELDSKTSRSDEDFDEDACPAWAAELFLEIPEGEELPENDEVEKVDIFREGGDFFGKLCVEFF